MTTYRNLISMLHMFLKIRKTLRVLEIPQMTVNVTYKISFCSLPHLNISSYFFDEHTVVGTIERKRNCLVLQDSTTVHYSIRSRRSNVKLYGRDIEPGISQFSEMPRSNLYWAHDSSPYVLVFFRYRQML